MLTKLVETLKAKPKFAYFKGKVIPIGPDKTKKVPPKDGEEDNTDPETTRSSDAAEGDSEDEKQKKHLVARGKKRAFVLAQRKEGLSLLVEKLKGGAGSGNFGHTGRLGKRGGSAGGGNGGGPPVLGKPSVSGTAQQVLDTMKLEGWSGPKVIHESDVDGTLVAAKHGKYQLRALINPKGTLEGYVLRDTAEAKKSPHEYANLNLGRTAATAHMESIDKAFATLRADWMKGKRENATPSLAAPSRYAERLVGRGRYYRPDNSTRKD